MIFKTFNNLHTITSIYHLTHIKSNNPTDPEELNAN